MLFFFTTGVISRQQFLRELLATWSSIARGSLVPPINDGDAAVSQQMEMDVLDLCETVFRVECCVQQLIDSPRHALNVFDETLSMASAAEAVLCLDGTALNQVNCATWLQQQNQGNNSNREALLPELCRLSFSDFIRYRVHVFSRALSEQNLAVVPGGTDHLISNLARQGVIEVLLHHLRLVWSCALSLERGDDAGESTVSAAQACSVSCNALEMSLRPRSCPSTDILLACAAIRVRNTTVHKMATRTLQEALFSFKADVLPSRPRIHWLDFRGHVLGEHRTFLHQQGLREHSLPNSTSTAGALLRVHVPTKLFGAILSTTGNGSTRRVLEVVIHPFSNTLLLLFTNGQVMGVDIESLSTRFSVSLLASTNTVQLAHINGDRGNHSKSPGMYYDRLSCAHDAPFVAINLSVGDLDAKVLHVGNHGVHENGKAPVAILETRSGTELNFLALRPSNAIPPSACKMQQLQLVTDGNALVCTFHGVAGVAIFDATTGVILAVLENSPGGDSGPPVAPRFDFVPERQWVVVSDATAPYLCHIWGLAYGFLRSSIATGIAAQQYVAFHPKHVDQRTRAASVAGLCGAGGKSVLENLWRLILIIKTNDPAVDTNDFRCRAATVVQFLWNSLATGGLDNYISEAGVWRVGASWCRQALQACGMRASTPKKAADIAGLVQRVCRGIIGVWGENCVCGSHARVPFHALVKRLAMYAHTRETHSQNGVSVLDDDTLNFACLDCVLKGHASAISKVCYMAGRGLLITAAAVAGEVCVWDAHGSAVFLVEEHTVQPAIGVPSLPPLSIVYFSHEDAVGVRQQELPLLTPSQRRRAARVSSRRADDRAASRTQSAVHILDMEVSSVGSDNACPPIVLPPHVPMPRADSQNSVDSDSALGAERRYVLFCLQSGPVWPVAVREFDARYIDVANGDPHAYIGLTNENWESNTIGGATNENAQEGSSPVKVLLSVLSRYRGNVCAVLFVAFRENTDFDASVRVNNISRSVSQLSGDELSTLSAVEAHLKSALQPHQFLVMCRGDGQEKLCSHGVRCNFNHHTLGEVGMLNVLCETASAGAVVLSLCVERHVINRWKESDTSGFTGFLARAKRTIRHAQFRAWVEGARSVGQSCAVPESGLDYQHPRQTPPLSAIFGAAVTAGDRWRWDFSAAAASIVDFFAEELQASHDRIEPSVLPAKHSKQDHSSEEEQRSSIGFRFSNFVLHNCFRAHALAPHSNFVTRALNSVGSIGVAQQVEDASSHTSQWPILVLGLVAQFCAKISKTEFIACARRFRLLPEYAMSALLGELGPRSTALGLPQLESFTRTEFLAALPLVHQARQREILGEGIECVSKIEFALHHC